MPFIGRAKRIVDRAPLEPTRLTSPDEPATDCQPPVAHRRGPLPSGGATSCMRQMGIDPRKWQPRG